MQVPTKQCSKCYLWLPYDQFNQDLKHRDKLTSRCKGCHRAYQRKTYNSSKAIENARKAYYGITQKQYDKMLVLQNGVCAICKNSETALDWRSKTQRVKSLAVDHDHKTGDVRALLCTACNTALGSLKEDPERIRALLAYAEWCQSREPDKKIIQLPIAMEAGS